MLNIVFSFIKINKTAYYGFEILLETGENFLIYRRYSQFDNLDSLIRAQSESHLMSSLPSLPPKIYNPYFDQTAAPFLDERKAVLSSYLNQILGNSKVKKIKLSI